MVGIVGRLRFDVVEPGFHAQLTANRDSVGKPNLIRSVVNRHLYRVDRIDLGQQARGQRKRQETVGDSHLIRRFTGRPVGVGVNPLMIAGGFGKLIDHLLCNRDVRRLTQWLAGMGREFGQIGKGLHREKRFCVPLRMNDQPATRFFRYRNQQLAYQRMGAGPRMALAFHGFGQTSGVYAPLAAALGNVYTIYAIDLFLHGASKRADSTHLVNEDWCACIGAFLAEQQIDRFTVMGYSLGGRFALVLAECFASRLDALVLMAPDGIRFSRWYGLATQSTVGRALFGFAMRHLPVLHRVGRGLVGLRLLRPSLLRFAEVSLSTGEQRQLVYDVWTQFRRIKPDLLRVADELTRHKVATRLIVGSYDQIVPASYLLPLIRLLTQYTLIQLPTGHNRLIDKSAAVLNVYC